jgi:hypothetical protein
MPSMVQSKMNISPIAFCVNEIFESAWLVFVHLQEIESNMQCSLCGPYPKVVIADGISVSFPNHHHTDTLCDVTAKIM